MRKGENVAVDHAFNTALPSINMTLLGVSEEGAEKAEEDEAEEEEEEEEEAEADEGL